MKFYEFQKQSTVQISYVIKYCNNYHFLGIIPTNPEKKRLQTQTFKTV